MHQESISYDQFKQLFKEFEVQFTPELTSINSRLSRLEDGLSIIATDNKRYSEAIIELRLKLEHAKKDIDNLGVSTREREKTCSGNNEGDHVEIFTRIKDLEKEVNKWKGIAIVIPIALGALFFVIEQMKGNN